MTELFAGSAVCPGPFIVGLWLLTENLKTLSTRRFRRTELRTNLPKDG